MIPTSFRASTNNDLWGADINLRKGLLLGCGGRLDMLSGFRYLRFDEGRGTLLQHYFDSRGVARVYEMTFDGRVWTLLRETPDFSPLDFAQRFEGVFSEDGERIEGRWEIKHEADWELDFHQTYTRVG